MNTPKIDDGGAAFPLAIASKIGDDGTIQTYPSGMTLRDWFAGQALSGLMANSSAHSPIGFSINGRQNVSIVEACYIAADAMIAEGKRQF